LQKIINSVLSNSQKQSRCSGDNTVQSTVIVSYIGGLMRGLQTALRSQTR